MDNDKTSEQSLDAAKTSSPADQSAQSSLWSYRLVVIMLAILAGLTVIIVSLPFLVFLWSSKTEPALGETVKTIAEYSKWTMSVLLGAFGAWIGAGAAYFFGKENLKESSRSTESALKIQQDSLRRQPVAEKIRDMNLTAINSNFIFDGSQTKGEVRKALVQFKGYWFVPVVDAVSGALRDVIHARVFWEATPDDATTLETVIVDLDKNPVTKELHGTSFYGLAQPDDLIKEVYDKMAKGSMEVAMVVDEKRKPTHCLSKTDLGTYLKISADR